MAKAILNKDFVDIIRNRREKNDAIAFMTKPLNLQRVYNVQNNLTPRDLKILTFQSKRLQKTLKMLSVMMNKNEDTLWKEVYEILEEIGLDRKLLVVRTLGIFVTKILVTVCDSVFVNEKRFNMLKSTLGNNPVVFVPTHRSYADFILVTYLCYCFDIELPAVAAGMDFHAMVGMGRVMRDTCAFYIRRTFASDKIYGAVFRQYVRTLVTKYYAPISFFIEGTRSRSGKSLYPKYGFMSMVLEPYFAKEVPDITFVPIYLNYDRVMEERLFAFELLGIPKPKESTSGLFKSLKILNENFGNIYINIGEPISAKEYFGNPERKSFSTIKPLDIQTPTAEENSLIQKLSHEIISRQQNIQIITTFQIIAMSINISLYNSKSIHFNELCESVINLSKILQMLGGNVFDYTTENVHKEVKEALFSHKNLVFIDSNSNVRLLNMQFDVTDDMRKYMKGHQLNTKTMSAVMPIILLQLYVNPIIHLLLSSVVLYVNATPKKTSKDALWEKYKFTRLLLKYEFPANESTLYNEFLKSLEILNELKVLKRENEKEYIIGENKTIQNMLLSSFWPFFNCLQRISVLMANHQNVQEKILIKNAQENIEQHLLNTLNGHPYSLSLDTIVNCINGFVAIGSLQRQKLDNGIHYHNNFEKTPHVTAWLRSFSANFSLNFDIYNPIILNRLETTSKM